MKRLGIAVGHGLVGIAMVTLAGCNADSGSDDGAAQTEGASGSGSANGTGPNADGTDTDGDATGPTTGPGDGSTTDDPPDPPDSTTDGSTGEPPDPNDAEAMCERWNADRVDLDEGMWSGNVAACDPGDISAQGRDNALRLLNLYRWMAELPAVTTDPSRDAMAQACALMMHANNALSHDPPMDWLCYSGDGATAAGSSNISGGPGVMSVDLYMVDPGNATTLGHRRWILSNSTGPVGLGSTSGSSCMWVLGGSGGGTNEWTAWPPPGPFPLQAVDPVGFASLDQTGWSVQSDQIDLSSAEVSVTVAGEVRPVDVTVLAPNFGSSSAISIVPSGWMAQAGTTYHVEVTGIGTPIEYDVNVVDCG